MLHACILHVFVSFVSIVNGDYDCVCNYNVELPVLPTPDETATPLGSMYEFDCKPMSTIQAPINYYTLQFEKQLGFVKTNSQVRHEICRGSPPDEDLIPTTTRAQATKTFTEEIKITSPLQSLVTATPGQTTPPIISQQITSTHTTTPNTSSHKPSVPTISTESTTRTSNRYGWSSADRPTLQLPITWPTGTYGLMKAASGCPMNNAHWEEGWRRQDTELTSNKNDHSPDILTYMSVILNGRFVTTSFCMKTNTHSISGSQYDQQWPSGAYCILKKGLCPTGLSEGYVYWDDEDLSNHNNQGGTLPDGNYDQNTKIYFCCRNDGSPNSPVFLPTDRPFILVRYGNTCQAVQGMNVHNVFIKWDDEDLTNKDSAGGMHPSDDGGSHDHLLHYCYYHAANSPSFIG